MFTTIILTLIMCAAMFIAIWAGVALHPLPNLVSFMPKDIQEKMKDHKPPFKGAKLIGWMIIIIAVIVLIGVMVYAVWDGVRNGYGFWQFFIRFMIILYGEKLFDIACLDYVLITKTHFFQHYWPETEGCEGYHQFGYNKKEQMVRLVGYPFLCALIAWICTLF